MSEENLSELEDQPAILVPDRPQAGVQPAVCPVIGLGASAGGLEAFQNFLAAVPADAGLAYVLVQHLDPNHESMLAELLSRRTPMPVHQISDGMTIEPNRVYLIPPNASLSIKNSTLKLQEFAEPRGFRRPIDDFFRSLALDQGANAACVVLSGTGGDGSEGLRAVKEAGGLTVVQRPDTAKYDGMPNSAVATGLVDKVLDVSAMPAAIRDYFERGPARIFDLPDIADFLLEVCAELRLRLGHDFSQYKRSTMLRRVQRRMQVIGAQSGEEYLAQLRDKPTEAELLFRDLLINVTCFFRDAEAFDALRREVIPALLAGKGAGDKIRIWAPGCSSGEEAYSIAILIAEQLTRARARPQVQIFATDIDEPMLAKARAARYPQSGVKDVPLELLDRYFFAQEDDFVLVQSIRDIVRVSNHNLIKDPPFSRVDMVVCRNLLIYLNADLQQRLVPVFHYALRPGGWLFLGSAENIASRNDLFEPVDQSARIYRRRGAQRQSVSMPLFAEPLLTSMPEARPRSNGAVERSDQATRRMLERYAPAHVVVGPDNEVIRASNRTGKYLELAEGPPTTKVTDLARRGLRSAVRGVLETARTTSKRAVQRDVRVDTGSDEALFVDVVADPLDETETLLVFQDATTFHRDDPGENVQIDSYSGEDRISHLEDELDETRLKLRTTVEELETSNEELKSSNEEMMSMNEELQSTNEELATVNEELKNKVDQLARANSDLHNFIEGTQVPTIFLDSRMRIRTFTPATRALFRFQEQDRGRLLSDVVSRADEKLVDALVRKVLETGAPHEEELAIEGGERYMLRVLPYSDAQKAMDGVILVFSDVTKVRQTQAELAHNMALARQRTDEIETLYKTAPVGMALVDRNQRFLKINKHFADLTGHAVEDHIGRTLREIAPTLSERMERPVEEVFENERPVDNVEATVSVNGGVLQDFLIDYYPYQEDGRTIAVGIVIKDISELRRLERELRRLMGELQHRVKNTLATVASIVNQTVATKGDRVELVDTLKKRIGALAATHSLLTQRDWRDASLGDIIRTEFGPYDRFDRISISGPDVRLPPKHALTLTLTLHELATNAAKYGALAAPNGKLAVDWEVREDGVEKRLTIQWRETSASKKAGAAHHEGFGTRLIKNAVVHDLGGRVEHQLASDGLQCNISVAIP
ncbi:MAG TPA: chemotaxis protein CheB [Rhizomicrobium sp.]|nr:chemotaxis protein CheB [Rhizomicrobium sp.]